MKFKKCMKCGALVEVINDCICDDCGITCCNSQMVELKPNSSDGAVEKHKPEYVVNGLEMKITVNHVMEENHYIMWIQVVNGESVYTKKFKPGDKAEITVPYTSGAVIYSYCNIHGLWETTVE